MRKPLSSSLSLLLGILAVVRLSSAEVAAATEPSPSTAEPPSASASAMAATPGATTASANDKDAPPAPAPLATGATAATAGDATATTAASAQASTNAEVERSGEGKKDKDKDKDKDDSGKLPWEVKPKVRVGALMHAEFAINDVQPDPDGVETSTYDFRLTNARIFVTWEQGSLLDAQAELELSRDRDRSPTTWAPMRDGFVRVSPDRALRLRMGQFKRPFGGLALTSLRELKLIRRGISDVWINEELGYGERDVGFMVEGKLGKKLELHYAVGVFNGAGRNRRDLDPNGAKDFVGRVEGHLGKHLTVAYNLANKRFDQNYSKYASYPTSNFMSGVDVTFEYSGFHGYVEGQYGSNYRNVDQHHTGSLLALAAYKIPLTQTWKLALEPVVKGEILKPRVEVRNVHVLGGTVGANFCIGDIFRLMVHGEIIEPKGELPANLGEGQAEKRLIFQAGMYTR